MPRYLMAISLGPVQGFIAAARRTRDFWMGSTILSECAKAVARELMRSEQGPTNPPMFEQLIFPAVEINEVDGYLTPIDFDADNSRLHNKFDVSNVVMAVVVGDEPQVRAFATHLETVAQERWRGIAREAAKHCRGHLRPDWDKQLKEHLIEFYSAWVPLADNYGKARQLVMRLLAGRKACRNFAWWEGKSGVPKSSLDGARESIVRELRPKERRGRLRVKPKEQLDLIGVAKRVDWGHDAIRYPSVSRVAIEPFVAGVERLRKQDVDVARLIETVKQCCAALKDRGALRQRKEKNPRGIEDDLRKFPWLAPFPFEGSPLYVSRHQEIVSELVDEAATLDVGEVDETAVKDELTRLRDKVAELQQACGISKPWEYVAFLVADGDGMGATLSELAKRPDGLQRHREFSAKQSAFAIKARELINNKFGACFYAGADDVLAMVSVHQAIECARELHDLFHEHVGKFVAELRISAPTLSVGIAIGHFMEPLEDLLDYARAAEQRAKNPTKADEEGGQVSRNGLAVAVHARGGVAFTLRGHWRRHNEDASTPSFDNRIDVWTELHRHRLLPAKAAYDLREAARKYEHAWVDAGLLSKALQHDAKRILARKRGAASRDVKSLTDQVRKLLQQLKSSGDLHTLAHELILGQWIGDALDQAEGTLTVPYVETAEAAR